jgi:hypothetical protein
VRIGSKESWRTLGAVIAISVGIALASVVVVRLRNINRGDTTAIEWALDDLRAIPESTLTPVCVPTDFIGAVDRYREAVRQHTIQVDSIREFYQLYARLARDGRIDSREVTQLGPYLGFAVHDSLRATDFEK